MLFESSGLVALFAGLCTLIGVVFTALLGWYREKWTWKKDSHRQVLRSALPIGPVVTKENYQKGNLHTQLERCLQEFRDGFYPETLFARKKVREICIDFEAVLQVTIGRLKAEADRRTDESFEEIQHTFLAYYNAIMPICKQKSGMCLTKSERRYISDYEKASRSKGKAT